MKFNTPTSGKDTTTNYMGAKAYQMTNEIELYSAVVTCMVDDSYYESSKDRLTRIKKLIAKCDSVFVAKLAIYARTQMNLRSIPIVLAIELAKFQLSNSIVRKTVTGVVRRADEIKEILAYYQIANKREGVKKLNKLSKQIQKGLSDSFNKFDEYQFAKYNTKTDVTLRDALFLVHPKAKDEKQQALFDRIVSDTLATPYTWETEMSDLGQQAYTNDDEKAKAIALKWEELALSGKLGYMAILRNIRNILTKSTDLALKTAIEVLTDKERIQKAKQMPFRYLSAFNEITKLKDDADTTDLQKRKIEQVNNALQKALIIACDNIQFNDGRTAILSDNSGSMYGDAAGKSLVSAMSRVKTSDIANLFAVLYWNKKRDTYVGLFGDRLINANLSRTVNIFDNFKIVNAAAKKCGPSTERGIFEYMETLIKTKTVVDRIIIFSDCQVGEGCNWYDNNGNKGSNFNALFQKYLKINPQVKVYTIDLKGYGKSMTSKSDNVVYVSGWSEKIFDMIYYIEHGSSIVDEILKIEL